MTFPNLGERAVLTVGNPSDKTKTIRTKLSSPGGNIYTLSISGYVVPTQAELAFLQSLIEYERSQRLRLEKTIRWLTGLLAGSIVLTVLLALLG